MLSAAAVALAPRAEAGFRNHQSVVPQAPAKGYPIILNTPLIPQPNGTFAKRQVYAADQIGRVIVSGGDFQQIEMPDGSVVARSFFTAWNLDTKAMVCPTLTFDNEVLAFAEGPTPTQMYVAGKFTKVAGADGVVQSRSRIALVDLATCSVSAAFKPAYFDFKIDKVAYGAGRLFVGGDFTKIGTATTLDVIAELDPATAAARPALDLTFTGTQTSKIKALGVSPAGNRLIFGGRFGVVAGNGLSLDTETAIVDITNPAAPVLTAHQWRSPYSLSYQQDISIAPDASSIGVVFRGTPVPGNNVFLVPTVESATTQLWVHAVGKDSVFGVGVSNNAVYISGHFCRIAQGPGPTEVLTPGMGITDCDQHPDGAWRGHIAALSITDGTPLSWNPGADSGTGGRELTVTTRGLLAGFDGERTNYVRTGALAFYDFGPGAEDTVAPGDVAYSAPAAAATVGNPVRISGSATDNIGVAAYLVAVRNDAGQWVQPNGALAATRYEFRATVKVNGAFDLDVVLPGGGGYTAEAKALDGGGQVSPNWVTRSFTANNTDAVLPGTTIAVAPTPPVPTETVATVSGTATDNVAVAGVKVRVRTSAGLYVQDDFSISTAVNDLPVTLGAAPAPSVTWSSSAGNRLPADTYSVEAVVTDTSNNSRTVASTFAVVAGTIPTPALATYTGFTPKLGNYTMGMTFSVASATPVTALGIFDANANGTLDNAADTPVALWRQSDKALLAQVTVAKTAVSEGGWFYGSLAAPVVLDPGVVYVVGALYNATGEPYGSGGTVTPAAGVTYRGRASLSGLALTYPTSQSTSVGYGIPNVKIGSGSSAPVVTITAPTAAVPFGQPATITGTATDNSVVTAVTLQVTNTAGQYLQPNGTFAATVTNLPASVGGLGTASASFSYTAGALPTGAYTITVVAVDGVANSTTKTGSFSVATPPAGGGGSAITTYTGFTPKNGNYTMGSTFQVDATMTAQALGVFDGNGNGVLNNAAATPIGLWRQSDQALLGQATVALNASSEGGWFYGQLATPVALQPGVTYVVASLISSTGEPYGSGGTVTMATNVRHTGRAYLSGATFGYPASQSAGTGYGIPNIRFAGGNAAPVVAPIANQATTAGTAIPNLTVNASDPEGAVLAFSATGLPGGLGIDATTGVISGTPNAPGTFNVTVTAADPGGLTGSASFTWTVAPAPQPPTVNPVASPSSPTGALIAPLVLTGSDPEGGTLTWSATGLPLGLKLNSTSGEITGTPVVVGSSSVTATATDPTGLTGSTTFTWTVAYGAPACAVVLANAKPLVTWTAVPGQTTYAVRRTGVFLANIAAPATTYADTAAPAGDHSYVVRSRLAGVTTDIVCQPDPITVA